MLSIVYSILGKLKRILCQFILFHGVCIIMYAF
jgi:hypothetical protein